MTYESIEKDRDGRITTSGTDMGWNCWVTCYNCGGDTSVFLNCFSEKRMAISLPDDYEHSTVDKLNYTYEDSGFLIRYIWLDYMSHGNPAD